MARQKLTKANLLNELVEAIRIDDPPQADEFRIPTLSQRTGWPETTLRRVIDELLRAELVTVRLARGESDRKASTYYRLKPGAIEAARKRIGEIYNGRLKVGAR